MFYEKWIEKKGCKIQNATLSWKYGPRDRFFYSRIRAIIFLLMGLRKEGTETVFLGTLQLYMQGKEKKFSAFGDKRSVLSSQLLCTWTCKTHLHTVCSISGGNQQPSIFVSSIVSFEWTMLAIGLVPLVILGHFWQWNPPYAKVYFWILGLPAVRVLHGFILDLGDNI